MEEEYEELATLPQAKAKQRARQKKKKASRNNSEGAGSKRKQKQREVTPSLIIHDEIPEPDHRQYIEEEEVIMCFN